MKKHALTAAALTAALAMGAVPAFAAEDASDATPFASDGTQSTTVSIETNVSQLSATVPVKMTVVAPAAGGDIVAPSEDKYAITNNSLIPIYVTKIAGSEVSNSGWKLLDLVNPTNAPTGTIGDISLTVNTKPVKASGLDIVDTSMKLEDKSASTTGGNVLKLKVAGKTTAVKSVSADPTAAVKITYTISGTDPTPPTPSN